MTEVDRDIGRATVRIGLSCNNRCIFCSQDGLADSAADLRAALVAARAAHDELSFVGGEPTLDDGLAAWIAEAHALGFRRIGVQTNGSRMADTAYAAGLARAGLTDVHFSLHGADAAAHDYHTERPGSFDRLLRAMHEAKTSGLTIVVTTVLTRSNFRVLGGLPRLLVARGVAAWFLSVPWVAGRAASLRDRVAPRLGLALPFALQTLVAARALALPTFVVGAPACLLGPLAVNGFPGERRAYAPHCGECAVRPLCPGVDAEYLARFEGDELSPRAESFVPARSQLTDMFVGAGELAHATSVAPPVAFRPRTSLPMLGKVKPALAEAASGTERRTGEALKEIFPTLFEGEKSSSKP